MVLNGFASVVRVVVTDDDRLGSTIVVVEIDEEDFEVVLVSTSDVDTFKVVDNSIVGATGVSADVTIDGSASTNR